MTTTTVLLSADPGAAQFPYSADGGLLGLESGKNDSMKVWKE